MATVHLTAKDAWRKLRSEGVCDVGYQGFCKWLPKLQIDLNKGINEEMLNALRNYARTRSGNVCRTHQNGLNKVQAFRALTEMKRPRGSQIVDTLDAFGAVSRSTVYRRGNRLLNGFSAEQEYSTDQIRTLIFGV